MISWHVVHGMNGAIMVLPGDGLKDAIRYERADYIGEQDYYLRRMQTASSSTMPIRWRRFRMIWW